MNDFKEFVIKSKTIKSWNNTHQNKALKIYPRNLLELKKIIYLIKKNKKYFILKTGLCSYDSKSINADNKTYAISLKKLNKLENINKKKKFFDVEAGAKISNIVRFLKEKNFTLYSVPGGEHITVGGAISANVIGKDSSKKISCFGDTIVRLEVLNKNGTIDVLTKQKNINDYVGSFGLNGIIIKARLMLKKIKSQNLEISSKILKNLNEIKKELENKNDYQYVQIDPFFRDKHFAISFRANFIKSKINLFKKINLNSYLHERIIFKVSSFFINFFTWNIFYMIFFAFNNKLKKKIDLHNFHYSSKYKHMVPLICNQGLYDYEILIKKSFTKSLQKIIFFLKSQNLYPIYIIVKKIYKSKNKFFYKFNDNGYAVAVSLNKKNLSDLQERLLLSFLKKEKLEINLSKTDKLTVKKYDKKNNLFLSFYKKMILKNNEISR